MTDIGAKYDGLSTQDSRVFPMLYQTPCLWDFDPLWYIDPPTHGILNPFLWYSFGKNEGIQFTLMRFKILWLKFDPWVKIPYGILNLGSICQGFKMSDFTVFLFLMSKLSLKTIGFHIFVYSGLNRFFCILICRTTGCFIPS